MLRENDTTGAENSSQRLEARTLRAMSERNAEVFDSLVREWEANVRVKPFMGWALDRLDAWGMERALAQGVGFTGAHLDDYVDRLFKEAKDSIPDLKEVDDPLKAWPAIWNRLKSEPGLAHDALLKVCTLWSTQVLAETDIDWKHGRFADLLAYQPEDDVLNWVCSLNWFCAPEERPGAHRLSPLQLAWLGCHERLCEAFLAAGADPDQSFPASSWPNWTLRKATQDFEGLLKETMDRSDAKTQEKNVSFLSEFALSQRNGLPGVDARLASLIRLQDLNRSLPAVSPTLAKPRF